MTFLMMLLSFFAFAESPGRWEFARGIVERHEFYPNGEEVTKPENSWQSLFAFSYLDSSFRNQKDCVYYRVPGDEPGKIKIKILPIDKDCNSEILASGDIEIENISHFKFTTTDNVVTVDFQKADKHESWKITTATKWMKPEPKLLMSSAEYKSPGMIYLAPSDIGSLSLTPLKDGEVCHDVNNDCQEVAISKCDQCEHGWHEIPNGCMNGPKKCGAIVCGGKDLPACRRGMAWQRKEMEFDCRVNSSFAWCSKGLHVTCDGDKAYCR
jgi:hypothetical protein